MTCALSPLGAIVGCRLLRGFAEAGARNGLLLPGSTRTRLAPGSDWGCIPPSRRTTGAGPSRTHPAGGLFRPHPFTHFMGAFLKFGRRHHGAGKSAVRLLLDPDLAAVERPDSFDRRALALAELGPAARIIVTTATTAREKRSPPTGRPDTERRHEVLRGRARHHRDNGHWSSFLSLTVREAPWMVASRSASKNEDGVGQELLDRHRLPPRLVFEGRLYLRLDR